MIHVYESIHESYHIKCIHVIDIYVYNLVYDELIRVGNTHTQQHNIYIYIYYLQTIFIGVSMVTLIINIYYIFYNMHIVL